MWDMPKKQDKEQCTCKFVIAIAIPIGICKEISMDFHRRITCFSKEKYNFSGGW